MAKHPIVRHGTRVTTTPHDALFKAAFSKLRHARGLLRALLPEPLERRLTWSTLRLESGIAVGDEELDEQRMDLVYSVRAGGRSVLLYVLCEHQSKVDPWMVFRLLCYLVAIWKAFPNRYRPSDCGRRFRSPIGCTTWEFPEAESKPSHHL